MKKAGAAATSARSGLHERNKGIGTPVTVYPVDIHALSATSPIAIIQTRPDNPGDGKRTARAIPLVMISSPASNKLGDDVSIGAITYVIAGSVIFEVLPEGAWESGAEKKWTRPGNSSDVLIWAKPLSEDSVAMFPFPSLKNDSAIQLPTDLAEHGYVSSLVLAF